MPKVTNADIRMPDGWDKQPYSRPISSRPQKPATPPPASETPFERLRRLFDRLKPAKKPSSASEENTVRPNKEPDSEETRTAIAGFALAAAFTVGGVVVLRRKPQRKIAAIL